MAETEQSRSEQATPFRREEARRRGSVARSTELGSLLALFALAAVIDLHGTAMIRQELHLDAMALRLAGRLQFDQTLAVRLLSRLLNATLDILLPLFLTLLVIGIAGAVAQTGPVFSFQPLKPDIDRLNPVKGLQRVFSRRLLYELFKNLLKLGLLGAAGYAVLRALLPGVVRLANLDAQGWLALGLRDTLQVVLAMALALLLVAIIDIAYARWSHGDQLKMSRREVREERKRRDGDPKIRARLRALRREMMRRTKAVRRVPEADILITNPTHLAVALLYRRASMASPQVIAKGAGDVAARMRELARRNGVPVLRDPPLARALFAAGELEREVPEAVFPAVARALVWAYAQRAARKVAA
jgi:flagellar biosynthetic protein FlhB